MKTINFNENNNEIIDNNHEDLCGDSDSGLEVIEEPTLRPSEIVRGNHNKTMSTITGIYNKYSQKKKLENSALNPRI